MSGDEVARTTRRPANLTARRAGEPRKSHGWLSRGASRFVVRRLLDPSSRVVVLAVDDAGDALREWIRSHRVTWERRPHFEVRGPRLVRTGYDVTLFARHPPTGAGCPGCPECRRIHEELRRVANAAMPSHATTTGIAFGPFAPELTMRSESGWDPEIELDVEVYQPGAVAPSDEDEAACVASFESGLQRLGARQGTWATR